MPTITEVNGRDLKKNSITDSKKAHAEQTLLQSYALPVSFTIDAWPCIARCAPLLKQSARKKTGGGTITVTIGPSQVSGKLDYYAVDYGFTPGAEGKLTITPTTVTVEHPAGTVVSTYTNNADNDGRGV